MHDKETSAGPKPEFFVTLMDRRNINLTRGWLLLGIGAVAASGLFSILLVLARTPIIQGIIPWTNFFHTALVVHVDLSVLIWFLSFSAALWCIENIGKFIVIDYLALGLATSGTSMIILAPFTGEAHPLLNNYVPVLQQDFFFYGLGLFAGGFTLRILMQLRTLSGLSLQWKVTNILNIGNTTAAISAAIALCIFIWSWIKLEGGGENYYEFLFWGPGHVLQYTYTVMVLIVWLWLSRLAGMHILANPRPLPWMLILAGCPVLLAPFICLLTEIDSPAYRLWFTDLMIYGGLCALPLCLLVLYRLVTSTRAGNGQKIARAALSCSIILYAAGGVLGFLIRGINVTIPAHYHGSIVGITLAFFGLTYYLLPLLNFRAPSIRPALIQIYLYGAGQLLHISGLAWSGGYGVQRKTAGAEQMLDRLPEIAGMAMMGLGGLTAIIGGILFVVIVLISVWPKLNEKSELENGL